MRDTYTSICQGGNSVPSRQQRDLAVLRLGSNIAKQATVWKYRLRKYQLDNKKLGWVI